MKRDIIAQLTILKQPTRTVAHEAEVVAAERVKLMLAIGAEPEQRATAYTLSDYAEYFRSAFLPHLTRSLAGVTAGFALLLGGWLTTVDAAEKSLPGDPLYGFKIATEQAQLRLASLERRAVLHTEFAERRLHEAVALQRSGDVIGETAVRTAFDAYTRSITSANADLHELRREGSNEALGVATAVEQRLERLDSALDQTVAISAGVDVAVEIKEAKDVSREVQSTVVALVVDSHEADGTPVSVQELEAMFKRELGDVTARKELDLHRVQMVSRTISAYVDDLNGVVLPTQVDIAFITETLENAKAGIDAAMEAFGVQNYRYAFERLRSVDGDLLLMEARLAEAEVAITTALTQGTQKAQETVSEDVSSGGTESNGVSPVSNSIDIVAPSGGTAIPTVNEGTE